VTIGDGDGKLREIDGSQQSCGRVIFRASRLEALLSPLWQMLAAT